MKTSRKKTARRKAGAKTARKKIVRRKAAKKGSRTKVTRKTTTRGAAARKPKTGARKTRSQTARMKAPIRKVRPRRVAKESGAVRTAAPSPSVAAAQPTAAQPQTGSVAAKIPERIGRVTHYYGHANAAIIAIENGELRRGDTIHVRGHTTDFYQRVERIECEHLEVESAWVGQQVGVEISQRVREGDDVVRVSG